MNLRALLSVCLATTLALAPPALAAVGGYQPASPTAPTTVTVNAPPTDLLTGPTNVTGAQDVIVNTQGSGAAALQITGTFTGLSGVIRGSVDGVNYVNVGAYNANTGAILASGSTITAGGLYIIPAAGYRDVEYHVTALSTGTAVVTLNSSAGALDPPNSVQAGGKSVTATNFPSTVDTGNGAAGASTLRVAVAPNTGSTTDKGGTITSGGTAQTAIASNAARKQWCIQNANSATEDLFVRANGTASASTGIDVPPGMQVCSGAIVDTSAISVFAATTSHAFYGFEVQ